jgi:iron-sulfur cluster repair protein YtfE (RIC family)
MGMQVPDSLKSGHEAIQAALKRATAEPDPLGETARTIARIMSGHMMREEKFALRPLGLLKALARGETPAELAEVAKLAQALRLEMPQMIDEHRQIAEALHALARNAEAAGKPEYVALAEEMLLHAHLEEDVLYPAAILVGKYAALVRGD